MLDETSRTVIDWASRVAGDAEPSLALPDSPVQAPHVSLLLIEFADHPPLRGNGRPPLQFIARYLVTVTAPETEDAHRILGELLFAALESATFDAELRAIDPPLWRAFGVTPRPAFVLSVPVRRARPEERPPQVRQPITIETTTPRVVEGVVVGPGEVPVPDARVELLGPGGGGDARSASTDSSGHFRMTVGFTTELQQLRVSAKNASMTTRYGDAVGSDGRIRLRFDPAEE